MDDVWGKLTYVNDPAKEPIIICKRKFVIGRAKDCDLSLGSKSISKHHCYLEIHDDGQIHLCDTSSNGTMLNKTTRVTREQSVTLKSGDEFSIAFQKDVQGIGFVFSNVKETEDSPSNDDTENYSFECDIGSQETDVSEHETKGQGSAVIDETKLDETATIKATVTGNPSLSSVTDDEMMDHLICSICQEIIYKCVSLLPCMHCFCSGCYSEWMALSQECPQCRVKVKRLVPNHIVAGLVETYLKRHPEKQRDADELKELDNKNKITKNMLYPQNAGNDEEDDGYNYNTDDDSYDSSSDDSFIHIHNELAVVPQRIKRHRSLVHNVKICRQCPDDPRVKRPKTGYEAEVNVNEASSSTQSGSQATVAQRPAYVCGPGTIHLPCRCCFKQMPDRTRDRLLDHTIPPQKCDLCAPGILFCHMYWGCDRPGCTGCLSPFKDVVLADNCLNLAINGNYYESAVLMDYLRKKKMSWRDVLNTCLVKLDANEYEIAMRTLCFTPHSGNITSSSVLCKECAYKCFSQLVYHYRKDIPKEELPADVTTREDCYWGRNCRTQTKQHHARKFNHICEQTRFG